MSDSVEACREAGDSPPHAGRGGEPQLSHCKGAPQRGCSAQGLFPCTDLESSQMKEGADSRWGLQVVEGTREQDRFADTSHPHSEWKELEKSTRQSILEGRTSRCPIHFSPFKVPATTYQRSQATVPDGSGACDASSGLLQCLHVTSPSRTVKIKQVIASRKTREETQKHSSA